MLRKVFALLLTLTMVALTGCGLADKAAEKAMEKALGVSVDEKKGEVTFQTKDGEKVTVSSSDAKEGQLPEGFPLPVFPGGKVASGGKLTVNGKTQYTVEITFKGPVKPVGEFYAKAIKEKGFGDLFQAESSDDEQENYTLSGQSEKEAAYFFIESNKATKEGTVAISYGDK